MLSASASAMLVSSVHSPGGQPVCPAAPVVRHRFKTARRHELDGGTERVADRQTEQSAAPSIQAKIRALTHAPNRIRVCRNGRDLGGGTCLRVPVVRRR